jgi:pectin methylesterase-like acyl-CoA thioesterase
MGSSKKIIIRYSKVFSRIIPGMLMVGVSMGTGAFAAEEELTGLQALVVATDSSGDFTSVNEAINAASDDGKRTAIFIKSGIYTEKVFIGNRWESSGKVISLIGEHVDSVVITWDDYHGKEIPYPGREGTITADGMTAATMTVTSPEFYMENITVRNPSTQAQAEALYQSGDRQVLKNCKILGNQDTHRTKKGRRYFYFRTTIEGDVDFIYAGGTCYFYQCEILSNSGGYLTAPEDIIYKATLASGKTLRYGFFFKDCDILAKDGVGNGSVYLGRPWGPECGSVFLNCRLGSHINRNGWQAWNGNESSACFAEYKSMNPDGSSPADISNRVSWSQQFTSEDVNSHMLLSKIYSMVSTTPFDPVPMVVAPLAPHSLEVDSNQLSWTTVDEVSGYAVFANGSIIGFSNINQYTDTLSYDSPPVYTVRSVGPPGNLSMPNGQQEDFTEETINTAINSVVVGVEDKNLSQSNVPHIENGILTFERPSSCRVFSVLGQELFHEKNVSVFNLEKLKTGIYLFRVSDAENGYTYKIVK